MSFARLFLAQKQSQAEAIVKYLEAQGRGQATNRGDHFVVGEDCVTFASGHLFEDAPPEHYDPANREWRREGLPIVPSQWVRLPKTRNTGGVEHQQLTALRRLVPMAQLIIHACDFDREGQLIGDEILEELGVSVPVARLPIVGYDIDSIADAFTRMVDNADLSALATAARSRSRADWLIGINLTRALTIIAKDAGYQVRKVSAGRVISPTLCLIVTRAEAIDAFVPFTHYWVGLATQSQCGQFLARWTPPAGCRGIDSDGRLVLRGIAADAVARSRAHTVATVASITDEPVVEPPPLPYSLARLQSAMNQRYRLTAQQTFDAADRLYWRHYAISYPRGSNRYYAPAHAARAAAIVNAIGRNLPRLAAAIGELDIAQRSPAFDASRVGSYCAMAPLSTTLDPRALTAEEQIVYEEICLSYLAQFAPDHRALRRTIVFAAGDDRFELRQLIITEPGWKDLRPTTLGTPPTLFELKVGQSVQINRVEIIERKTQAPEPFTDGTLIDALNSVDDYVRNPELKAHVGHGASIGSEARQGHTIETLIQDGCVRRDRHYLVPTSIARVVAQHAMPPELRGPAISVVLDRALERVARGSQSSQPMLVEVERLVRKMCAGVLATVLPPNTDWQPKVRERKQMAHA